ncbi:MAG: hypothetical protein QHH15_00250 [Candidatus Thermoplasmatota archaeon]|nr:hypothetical protein [Candidatus Thermoplasmatota archaeon]
MDDGYDRPIRGDMLNFFNTRPDKLLGITVAGNDATDDMKARADYVATGEDDQTVINDALVDARNQGLPVFVLNSFVLSDSIVLKAGDCFAGYDKTGCYISFGDDLEDENLIMIDIQDERPAVDIKNLTLTQGDPAENNNDVQSMIETTGLGNSGVCYLNMERCIIWCDTATGFKSDCIQGYIQHCKFAASINAVHGVGVDVAYPYNLTFYDVMFGMKGKGFYASADAGATNLIGCFNAGCTTPLDVAGGTVRVIGGEEMSLKKRSTATIANGQTSVTVTHGLKFTPTAQNITVTPTNSLGNATKWYIDEVGATTFKIKVDTDPGATTATFSWVGEY